MSRVNIGRPPVLTKCRSFERFCKDKNHTGKFIIYPCFRCNGKGWIYDPLDSPDPYEGNKLRNTLRCPTCDRSGIGKRKDLYLLWKREKTKWTLKQKEYNNMISMLRNIESKLKSTEIQFLRSVSEMRIKQCFI